MIPLFLVVTAIIFGQVTPEPITLMQLEVHIAQARRAKQNCGPIALWYTLRKQGLDVEPKEVVSRAKFEHNGTSLDQLLELSKSFGIRGRALRASKDRLRELPTSTILELLITDQGKPFRGELFCAFWAANMSL